MRLSFLLLIVLAPAIAVADVATPAGAAAGTRAGAQALRVGDRTVTVGFGTDRKIHVRVEGGGELVLEPAGRAYVAPDELKVAAEVVANAAPVPLVKVSSRPEACSDYWDIYVSVVDGVPRKALELDGVADPPAMQTSTAKFDARDGTALVTTRTSEDENGPTRTRRTRWRWDGRVFQPVGPPASSKRAGVRSK